MYNLTIINTENKSKLTFGVGTPYTIADVQGTSATSADIHTTELALYDGNRFNSAKVQPRSINISFTVDYDYENARHRVYKVAPPKKAVQLVFKTQQREVYIIGYVQDCTIEPFAKKEICNMVIICPNPFFNAMNPIINRLSDRNARFSFPFGITEEEPQPISVLGQREVVTIVNNGETETGLIIEATFQSSCSSITIAEYESDSGFTVTYNFLENDDLFINTNRGEKTVTLYRNGIKYNLFSAVTAGSTWFTLSNSNLNLLYSVTGGASEDVKIKITHTDKFIGI